MTAVDRVPLSLLCSLELKPLAGQLRREWSREQEAAPPPPPVDKVVIRDLSGCQTPRKGGHRPWSSRLPEIPQQRDEPNPKLPPVPVVLNEM